MARKITIPGQNLSYDLPEENETFRLPQQSDPVGSGIYTIKGGQLLSYNPSQLRESLNIPMTQQVDFKGGLQQLGLNYESLPQYGIDDTPLRIAGITRGGSAPFSSFLNQIPQRTGEQFTQTAGQTNPNAAVIASSLRGQLQGEAALPYGITPTGQVGTGGFPLNRASLGQPVSQQTQALSRQQQIQNAQASLADIQRTFVLAQQQRASDIQAGAPQTFQPGTAIPAGLQAQPAITPSTGVTGTAGIGAPTEVAQPSLSDQYFKQLLESLKPSTEETETQKRLSDIIAQQAGVTASRDLGIQAVGEQPIAMPFISGQQAALTGRAATQLGALGAQAVPLQQRLAMEQAKRQSSVDITKETLGYQQEKEKAAALVTAAEKKAASDLAIAGLGRSPTDIYGTGSVGEYNFAKSQGYKGTFTQYQNEDANRKAVIAKSGVQDLTAGQIQATINQILGQFDNEPVVKNYNVISEGYQFARSLGDKEVPSSADDIGLIYAFAKIMDPNSVVREGEYATVQKYAQSWAQAFGFKVQRIFSNQPFLSQSAKENMVNTIKTKYNASRQNYDNVHREYQRRIDDAKSGKVTGSITNYAAAYDILKSPDGTQEVSISDLTPAQIKEAQDAGWQ